MPKILAVDDSQFICTVIQSSLSEKELEILTVQTAEEGIRCAGEWLPDLVLLDIALPDMDGFSACAILKNMQETAGIPIIFITGQDGSDNILKAFEAGAVDYINKPFNVVELKARVHAHLKNKLMTDHLCELNLRLSAALAENRRLATEDPLTGLYNRRYTLEYLENCRLSDSHRDFALLMGDVDDFKRINDSYGHHAGDFVLCQISEMLKNEVGERGIVCRWGGEEILVLLNDCSPAEAFEFGTRMCRLVWSYPFQFSGKELQCGITFGAARLDREAPVDYSIGLADQALYIGKQQGKNRCLLKN